MSFRIQRRTVRSAAARIIPLAAAVMAQVAASVAPAAAQDYRKWYLAEGATGRGADFIEDILIANPSGTDTRVRITFLPGEGPPPAPHELTVKATSRATVRVNALPGLSSSEVSAVVESLDGVDIVVERTMAWPSLTRRGAHNATGVTRPATRWFLAEGSTGFFNTFVLVANPSATQAAEVRVTFLLPGGGTVVYKPNANDPSVDRFTLAPNTRINVWPNAEVLELAGGRAFSTIVESLNSVEILAERAMYWNTDRVFEGGHGTVGVTQPSTTWLFAEGTTRSLSGLVFNTFLLLSNPSASSTLARVSFFTSPGTPPLERDFPLEPNSRENVWVNIIPELANKDFSMKVESLAPTSGGTAQPIVAERAVYWGPGTGPPVPNWVDGHSTAGVTAEAKKWVFAEGLEDGFAEAPGLNFDTYFLISNSSASPLDLRGTFVREDGTGVVATFSVDPESRFTIAGFQFPELTNQRFAAFFESTNGTPFVAERAVYWGAGYFAGHASTGIPWPDAAVIATPPSVPAPSIASITPNRGPVSGGTTVVITGANFTSGPTTVSLGNAAATGVTVVNATTMTAVTSSLATTADQVVDLVVVNNGVTRTLAAAFTYEVPKAPEITTISPATGRNTGGTIVTITGKNFNPASLVVAFGTVVGTVTEATPTSLKVTTPPRTIPENATSAAVDLRVTTNGATATAANGFTYTTFTTVETVLAFGDSITLGVTNCVVSGVDRVCAPGDGGYPVRLQQEMDARYPTQASLITVRNLGLGGELTAEGRTRLPSAMQAADDLVVILEGINDLGAETIAISAIASNIRQMVQTAKSAGTKVILCTLTPFQSTAFNPDPVRLTALNEEIVKIAQQEAVTLADLFGVMTGNPSYLSGDGLHPTSAGYRRMAQELVDRIRQTFEP